MITEPGGEGQLTQPIPVTAAEGAALHDEMLDGLVAAVQIARPMRIWKETISVGNPTDVPFDGEPRVLRAETADSGRQVHIWFLADPDAPRTKVAVVGTGHQFSGQWLATTAPDTATGLVWHVVKWGEL